jgi:hypothetical protein
MNRFRTQLARLTAFAAAMLLTAALGAAPADAAAQPAAGPMPVKLFILSGQSNAGGKGVGSELPEAMRQGRPDVLLIGKGARELTPLKPYPRRGFGTDNSAFGPEMAFAHAMKAAYPGHIIVIAKHTEGACSIIAWDKDWHREGWKRDLALVANEKKEPQYPQVLELAERARKALAAEPGRYGPVEIAGMLWVQSERDDNSAATAAMYEKNLRALIANLRQDLGAAGMPFVFADVNGRSNTEVIRAGMQRVVAEVDRTAMVPIAGLSRADGVHYDTQGQLELGRRLAEAYLSITKPPSAEPAR